jgi:hypothetical protein
MENEPLIFFKTPSHTKGKHKMNARFKITNFIFTATLIFSGIANAQAPAIVKNSQQGGAIEFWTNPSGTVTKQGSMSSTGAFSLGPVSSGNYNAPAHFINGQIWAGNVTASDESGLFTIGTNAKVGTQAGLDQRTQNRNRRFCNSNGPAHVHQ